MLLVLSFCIGAGALWLMERHRDQWQGAIQGWLEAGLDTPWQTGLLLGLPGLPLLLFAFYLLRFGRRSVEQERFPPSGVRLLNREAPLQGRAAIHRGRGLQLLAVLLGLAALGLPLLLGIILYRLGGH